MNPTIEITIAPDGSSSIETKGHVGNTCREASRFLENTLGRQTSEQLKPEFYQAASQQESVQQQS